MSITDFANQTNEVRVRQGGAFVSIPNNVEAGELLADGMFVKLSTDGKYVKATTSTAATHICLKSAEPRVTHTEVANLVGTIQSGEPCLALTGGPGTASIPIAENVVKGDYLMVHASSGYAIKKSGACFVVGQALEDVTLNGETFVMADALITLPAQYRAS